MESYYSTQEVSALLGVGVQQVRDYARAAGLGGRDTRPQGPFRFTFQEVTVLRACRRLAMADLSHTRITRALTSVRRTVPEDAALSTVHFAKVGHRIVASLGGRRWDAETGQLQIGLEEKRLMSAEPAGCSRGAAAGACPPESPVLELPDDGRSAKTWFEAGLQLEEAEPQRAYQAYLRALACDPEHVEAMINIGRLCASAGDQVRSAAYARLAIRVDPAQPVAHFNLGVTLHDIQDWDGAMSAYRTALVYDPNFADAHYNLATLLQQRGDEQGALRHMEAYRAACERGSR